MIKNCLNCDKKLPKDRYSWHRKYCSRKCQNQYLWRKWVKENPDKAKGRLSGRGIWRQKQIKLLGGKCIICQTSNNPYLHHIQPKEFGGTDRKKNLVVLCERHHKKVHRKLRLLVVKRIAGLIDFKSTLQL